jgi:hypothetical protein
VSRLRRRSSGGSLTPATRLLWFLVAVTFVVVIVGEAIVAATH